MNKVINIIVLVCLAISVAFNIQNKNEIEKLDIELSMAVREILLTKSVLVSVQNTNSNCFTVLFDGNLDGVGDLVKEKQSKSLEFLGEEANNLGLKMEKLNSIQTLNK